MSGSVLTGQSLESASDSVSTSLYAPPPFTHTHAHSLSLSLKSKDLKKKKSKDITLSRWESGQAQRWPPPKPTGLFSFYVSRVLGHEPGQALSGP